MGFKFCKSNSFYILFFSILLLGVILRVIGINRTEGFWYDEINTYYIAKQAFPLGIFKTLLEKDLHFPLYYMLVHLWMNIFGTSDLALKALPVLFGILTLPISYFVGKELHGKQGGIATLFFFSINSGLIYYSQELRFYSLIVFLATLSALFLLKIRDNPSKLNCIGLIISNLLIIYTWTIGCVFVFFEMLLFLAYLIYKKKNVKNFIFSNLIILIFSIPMFPLLIYFSMKRANFIFNYFDYYQINYPSLLNLIDAIGGPLSPRYSIVYNKLINILISLSVMIFSIFIIKSITKRKIVLTLFLMGLIPFLLEFILALQGKFAFIYCHTIVSIPFFIIAASCGLFQFKNKIILYTLLIIYVFINLGYTFFSPKSVIWVKKADGFNIIAQELNSLGATKQDSLILIPFGGYIATKYDYKARIVPLCLNDYSFNNKDAFNDIFDVQFLNSLNKENVYYKLEDFVKSKEPTSYFKKFVQTNVLDITPKNRYVFVAMINYGTLKYSKNHMIDPIRDKIAGDSLLILTQDKRYHLAKINHSYCWYVFTYKRIN